MFDDMPHVLIVYRTPGDDETPDSRWESPGITTCTAFPSKTEAEEVGKQLSAYTGVEYDVVHLESPVGQKPLGLRYGSD